MMNIFPLKFFKNIIFASYSLTAVLYAQNLEELSFGDDVSLDIATWNIEWFPKNDQITIDYIIQIITFLDLDIIAIQEVDDTTMFDQMLDSLPSYSGYYESSWFAGLAYIFKTDQIEINEIYEIYTTQSYWNAFPRSPMVMDFNFLGENYIIINNHFKCCGDGIIDFDDSTDEEYRRYIAINYLKEYVDNNFSNRNVIVLGDLNDDIAEGLSNNVFQDILNDSANYHFADLGIAQGNSTDWSFPNWPSHLDHILITDELFSATDDTQVETIKIDQYLDGGWSEYDQNISDHRPVAIKIDIDYSSSYDVDGNGTVDDFDLSTLLYFIMNEMELIDQADVNFDLFVDLYDLIILADFLQQGI